MALLLLKSSLDLIIKDDKLSFVLFQPYLAIKEDISRPNKGPIFFSLKQRENRNNLAISILSCKSELGSITEFALTFVTFLYFDLLLI